MVLVVYHLLSIEGRGICSLNTYAHGAHFYHHLSIPVHVFMRGQSFIITIPAPRWCRGPWDTLIAVLLAFVALDYLMGVINAICKQTLSSAVGFKGLAKKVAIFVMVGLAALLDRVAPMNGAIRAAVCLFYIANEGISILENAGAIGLPLPDKLKETLAQLKDKRQ